MKILLALLCLLPALVVAQSKEPFKKASTIVINTGLSPEEAFVKWGRHLAQNGYAIAESNKDFYTISTDPKDTSRFNYAFVVNAVVNDAGVITLKIKWQLKSNLLVNSRETAYYDWEYATAKNNVQQIIYQDLLPTLSSFQGIVSYF
ncbi:hypothetical protein ACSX1A_19115 [Pontibacter sp. MBLB2868]|uniref:hypothetical protein n=1 Tax=Pontibacter sp. MBLB2868 TaxID=3451555 RepID=UPI003F752576